MKKIFLIVLLLSVFLLPDFALAQQTVEPADCTSTAPSATLCDPTGTGNLRIFAFRLIQAFSTFFALAALLMVVYSGFRMVISQGDSEALTVAKGSFFWSIAGLVLAMFAFVLISATGTFLGALDPNDASYEGDNAVRNPLMDSTFYGLLVRILTGFLSIAGLIAILLIVIGGFRYITSAGNEEQAESGKKTLQWAVTGLLIILLSYVLVRATLTFFGN